jgi:hypothetical protein
MQRVVLAVVAGIIAEHGSLTRQCSRACELLLPILRRQFPRYQFLYVHGTVRFAGTNQRLRGEHDWIAYSCTRLHGDTVDEAALQVWMAAGTRLIDPTYSQFLDVDHVWNFASAADPRAHLVHEPDLRLTVYYAYSQKLR